MTDLPKTRYTRSGDVHIGYQVVGEGPDLLLLPPAVSHLELRWDDPGYTKMLRGLSSFSRLISFDRRGSGVSDRVPNPTLEEEVLDVLAVLDEVGSERAYLFGGSEGAALALFFAATHPARTTGVISYAGVPRMLRSDDFPIGVPRETLDQYLAIVEAGDLGGAVALLTPSMTEDKEFVRRTERMLRSAVSPSGFVSYLRSRAELDIRHVLPTISVPVLLLHRTGDLLIPVAMSRYLAEHIPGARLLELPGSDYAFWVGDVDTLLTEIEEFVTGTRPVSEPDRVLATVLFTDIVASTERTARTGDRAWRELLDRHDEAIATELRRFNGRQVKTTGDGVLATFDGPARAVRCACSIRDVVDGLGIQVRAGLHSGEIELRDDDVAGIAVNTAQRISSLAGPAEVLVSRTVTDLVAGSGLEFDERGEHELKGVPGRWQLYAVRA